MDKYGKCQNSYIYLESTVISRPLLRYHGRWIDAVFGNRALTLTL